MSAARDPSPTAPPTAQRDGFHLISQTPIDFDIVVPSVDSDSSDPSSFTDIVYSKSTKDHCACIAFNRPEVLHAFRPTTIREIQRALEDATEDPNIAVILLASTTSPKYTLAFCAGGDQTVRSDTGGGYQDGTERPAAKLRVLDLQIQMRRCPKPIVAVVRGYAVGGGHILHMLCDLTLCSENAVFGQTGPRMGSFDAGYGCSTAVSLMGQKRARELWFLSRFYSAKEALEMGLVNALYRDDELDGRVGQWVRRMVMNSPTAIAACKASCNAVQDGAAGMQQMGGELTRLFYMSSEGQEGRKAFLEKRAPQFRSKL
jgi:naphthoate synthase